MQFSSLGKSLRVFGIPGTLKLILSKRRLRRFLPDFTQTLHSKSYRHPIHFRHGTTDRYVIEEVLLKEQYLSVITTGDVSTIIDAGANIGTASIYFLNKFPNATVIAIEPDPGNFKTLGKNLFPYGNRVILLQNALWPVDEKLTLNRGGFRDGGEWSIQVVRSSDQNSEKTLGITVQMILNEYNLKKIDIFKIDVEGSEKYLFENPDQSWIDNVRCFAIELHDPESQRNFLSAVEPHDGTIERHGEVTLWRQRHT